jgi:hypothetical protein
MSNPSESLPSLTLEQTRALERSGQHVHLVPSIRNAIPDGTPAAERLTALRAGFRLQLLVVEADADDEPSEHQLGLLQGDPMALDILDAQTLETCDRLTQEVRRRTDALLLRLLDAAAVARRGTALGAGPEAEARHQWLGLLEQAEYNAVALRHQWQGSFYHQFVRGRVHTAAHREAFRSRMEADYARIFQALDLAAEFADAGL